MAATARAALLTQAHRLAQVRLGAETVRAMRGLFTVLDPTRLDATYERWLHAVIPVLRAQRQTSVRISAAYLSTFKHLEVGGSVDLALAPPLDVRAASTSLLVTGPYRLKKNVGIGTLLDRAVDIADSSSAAAAMRHVLNGGRETIVATVTNDQDAHGWARVASGEPCAFCAMLASRGPVYHADTVDFEAHDHCSCTAEPVYRDDAAWPAGSEHFHDLWQQAKDAPGDTTTAFRELVEA